jgi:hypothetical protein
MPAIASAAPQDQRLNINKTDHRQEDAQNQ